MPSAAMASARRTIRTILSESGPGPRRATCWCRSARLISVSPTRNSFRSIALSAATPRSGSARYARAFTRPTTAWCSRWPSKDCSARHGTNRALPCAFPASTAYAGTNAPRRPIGWKRSSECWRRSRADAPRPLPQINMIGSCHDNADAVEEQLYQPILWWAALVGHLPTDPAVDPHRRNPASAGARPLEHLRKPRTARAARLGHGFRRGALALGLSPLGRRRGGADLAHRGREAGGQRPVSAMLASCHAFGVIHAGPFSP